MNEEQQNYDNNEIISLKQEIENLKRENSRLKDEIVDVKNQLKDAEDEIQHIFYDLSMAKSRFCVDE